MRPQRYWAKILARLPAWRGALVLTLLALAGLACALPGAATPTATTGPLSSGGSSSSTPPTVSPTPSATFTPSPSPSPTVTFTPSPSPSPTETPTPTPNQTPSLGPYVVKQTETLGGEVISGIVCRLTQPFVVNSVTPKVAFAFLFTPEDAVHGKVTYAYSIPSAGESHDAKGTYTLGPPHQDRALTLSLTVSDHVVFKGFDGNIPNRYKFDLVPNTTTPCP